MIAEIRVTNKRMTDKERNMALQVPAVAVVTAPADMAGQLKIIGNKRRPLLFGSGKTCFTADFLL